MYHFRHIKRSFQDGCWSRRYVVASTKIPQLNITQLDLLYKVTAMTGPCLGKPLHNAVGLLTLQRGVIATTQLYRPRELNSETLALKVSGSIIVDVPGSEVDP